MTMAFSCEVVHEKLFKKPSIFLKVTAKNQWHLSKNVHGNPLWNSAIRKNVYILPGDRYRLAWKFAWCCVPYVSFSTFGGDVFRGLQMRDQNGTFCTIYLRRFVVAMCCKPFSGLWSRIQRQPSPAHVRVKESSEFFIHTYILYIVH